MSLCLKEQSAVCKIHVWLCFSVYFTEGEFFFFKVTLNISKSFFLLQHVDKILYPDTVLDTSLRGALVSCIVRLHHFFINQLSCIQAKSEAIINFAFIQREMHVCVHSCTHTHNSHTQSLY